MEYNNIDKLPDDIISHIFSFLTVRDALIARLASPGWRHLTDSRSVLHFDSLSVFGKQIRNENSPSVQDKFVKIVNRFMKIWAAKRVHSLFIKFRLGEKERALQIRKWVANCVRLKVEEIELVTGTPQERFILPSCFILSKNSPNLKRLCLRSCSLSISFRGTSCLSNLTTIDMSMVSLKEFGWDAILSSGSNLVSVKLYYCNLPKHVCIDDGQLPRLKKLNIMDDLLGIKLNCPSLEVLECDGSIGSMMFVHVPLLREAKFMSTLDTEGCSKLFDHVTEQAPRLQALQLMITTEVKPVISTLVRCCLKELTIRVTCVDLLTVTYLLDASPFLEKLNILQLERHTDITSTQRGENNDHCHYNLKEVEIRFFYNKWNGMELAKYLLRNSVALEQMVIRLPRDVNFEQNVKSLRQMQNQIKPTACVHIF